MPKKKIHTDQEEQTEYDRDCPKCGSPTEVNIGKRIRDNRQCTNEDCNWWMRKGGRWSSPPSDFTF